MDTTSGNGFDKEFLIDPQPTTTANQSMDAFEEVARLYTAMYEAYLAAGLPDKLAQNLIRDLQYANLRRVWGLDSIQRPGNG